MQTIPIIISEKILKKIFIEVIDEINKFFKYNYEIIDQYTEVKKEGGAIVADLQSIKNISVEELKLFLLSMAALTLMRNIVIKYQLICHLKLLIYFYLLKKH